MKMKVEIDLDNEGMQTGREVADALGRIVFRIEDDLLPLTVRPETRGPIQDRNGNTVGKWEVVA